MQYLRQFISKMRTFFIEYFDNSNIHGVRYFSERMLHWSERFILFFFSYSTQILNVFSNNNNNNNSTEIRLLWLITIGVCFWLYGAMVHNAWIGWTKDPVIFSYTEEKMGIETIPFPTVTICYENKVRRYKNFEFDPEVFNLADVLRSLSNLSDVQ